jgi:hypothetical protein
MNMLGAPKYTINTALQGSYRGGLPTVRRPATCHGFKNQFCKIQAVADG